MIAAAAKAQTFIEIPGSPFPNGLGPVEVAAGYFTDSGIRISTDLFVLNRDALLHVQFSNWINGVANPALASTSVTLTAPLTITANVIPTKPFFVTELYRNLLGRNPDTGGLT